MDIFKTLESLSNMYDLMAKFSSTNTGSFNVIKECISNDCCKYGITEAKVSMKNGMYTATYTYFDVDNTKDAFDAVDDSMKRIYKLFDTVNGIFDFKGNITYKFPKLSHTLGNMTFEYDGERWTHVLNGKTRVLTYDEEKDIMDSSEIGEEVNVPKSIENDDDKKIENQVCVKEIDNTVTENCEVIENTDSTENDEMVDMKKMAFNLKSHIDTISKKKNEENDIYDNCEKCEKKFCPVIALDIFKEKINDLTDMSELPECLKYYRDDNGELSGFYMNLTDFYGVEDDVIETIWDDEEEQTDMFCNLACENFGFTHVRCNPVKDKDDNIINIEFDFVF